MQVNLSTIKKSQIYLSIIILTFILYGNSINNEYSLDDNIVVDGNVMVENGIKAIPKIFQTRYSTGKQEYEYRPMVTSSFAVEKQLFSQLPQSQTKKEKKRKDVLTQANISHFINVLLYAFTCMLLYHFLSKLLINYNILISLVTTVIFLVHPIHTEVVSSIKNRDEMFVLIGILLSLVWFLRYVETNQLKYIAFGVLATFFALLSKPNSIMIFGIAPVVLYFAKVHYKKIALVFLCLALIYVSFILMRKGLLTGKSTRILLFFENPLFKEGTWVDRITVGLYCSWFYLKMLIYPVKMSFYYGYNQIPMATFSFWQVWAAIIFFIPLGIYGLIRFVRRDILGLGIVLWFGVMLGVINLIFPIVGIVADRFTYAFSLGFCVVLAWLLLKIFKIELSNEVVKIKLPSSFLSIFLLVLILYSGRAIARNPDWHDYMTLYTNDIEHLRESAKAHALLANTLYPLVIKEIQQNPNSPQIQKDVQTLIYHFKEAIRIDSTYSTSWNNLGSIYVNYIRDYNQAISYCKKAIEFNPNYLEAHFNIAYSYSMLNNYDSALYYSKRVIEIDAEYLKIYDLYNGIATKADKIDEGIELLIVLAQNSQKPKNIYVSIANLYSINAKGDYSKSIEFFEKAYQLDNTDKLLCNHLAKLHNMMGNTQKASDYLIKCGS